MLWGSREKAFLVDGMKPAMETAAEENTEQSQERKVNSRAEMEIGRYHWMYPGSKNHQYRPVPTLGDRAGPLSSPGKYSLGVNSTSNSTVILIGIYNGFFQFGDILCFS